MWVAFRRHNTFKSIIAIGQFFWAESDSYEESAEKNRIMRIFTDFSYICKDLLQIKKNQYKEETIWFFFFVVYVCHILKFKKV